jgi:hypothetical protein
VVAGIGADAGDCVQPLKSRSRNAIIFLRRARKQCVTTFTHRLRHYLDNRETTRNWVKSYLANLRCPPPGIRRGARTLHKAFKAAAKRGRPGNPLRDRPAAPCMALRRCAVANLESCARVQLLHALQSLAGGRERRVRLECAGRTRTMIYTVRARSRLTSEQTPSGWASSAVIASHMAQRGKAGVRGRDASLPRIKSMYSTAHSATICEKLHSRHPPVLRFVDCVLVPSSPQEAHVVHLLKADDALKYVRRKRPYSSGKASPSLASTTVAHLRLVVDAPDMYHRHSPAC